MPIEYTIDHDQRLVIAKGRGIFSDADVFGYQLDVGSRPDVAGYDELIDMTEVEHIALPSIGRIRQLAELGVKMDSGSSPSRFAIVAPDNIAFGLGHIYKAYRRMNRRSMKKVGVFRSFEEAYVFLGIEEVLQDQDAA
jgi:hypothetical protein